MSQRSAANANAPPRAPPNTSYSLEERRWAQQMRMLEQAQDCDPPDSGHDHDVNFVKGWRNILMGRAWKNNGCCGGG
eukprot:5486820-Prymnesium_polylepis.1